MRRKLIWGFLVVVLVALVAVTIRDRMRRPEPPPVLDPVPAFALVNRDGRPVQLRDLAGAPWIADFIFTRCPASCPLMTARMARLERELPRDLGLRLVSFTVDPERDTPAVLERYAESYKAPGRWLFLTGPKEEIYRLSRQGFKLGIDFPPNASTGHHREPGRRADPAQHPLRAGGRPGAHPGVLRRLRRGVDGEAAARPRRSRRMRR